MAPWIIFMAVAHWKPPRSNYVLWFQPFEGIWTVSVPSRQKMEKIGPMKLCAQLFNHPFKGGGGGGSSHPFSQNECRWSFSTIEGAEGQPHRVSIIAMSLCYHVTSSCWWLEEPRGHLPRKIRLGKLIFTKLISDWIVEFVWHIYVYMDSSSSSSSTTQLYSVSSMCDVNFSGQRWTVSILVVDRDQLKVADDKLIALTGGKTRSRTFLAICGYAWGRWIGFIWPN